MIRTGTCVGVGARETHVEVRGQRQGVSPQVPSMRWPLTGQERLLKPRLAAQWAGRAPSVWDPISQLWD